MGKTLTNLLHRNIDAIIVLQTIPMSLFQRIIQASLHIHFYSNVVELVEFIQYCLHLPDLTIIRHICYGLNKYWKDILYDYILYVQYTL